jgi:hypothetical protein
MRTMANTASTLFVRPPEIDPVEYLGEAEARKCADVRLQSPPTHWADEITQALLREHPYLPANDLSVTFKNRDDASGYGVGFISSSDNPHLSIPIIINQRTLKPLDTLIIRANADTDNEQSVGNFTDDKVVPLNEDNWDNAVDIGEPGDVMKEHEVKGTRWSDDGSSLQMPFRGRTVVAHVLGATEEQKEAFGGLLSADKEVAAGFALHNQGVAQDWLNADAPGNLLRAKLAGQEVKQAEARIVTDVPTEVDGNSFLAAAVFTNEGEAKLAVAVDVVDLRNPLTPERIYLFEDGVYCMAPEKVAVANPVGSAELEDVYVNEVLAKVGSRGLNPGDIVSFQLDDTFTSPSKIASISINEHTKCINLDLIAGMGVRYPVTLSGAVKTAMVDTKTGNWVLPLANTVLKFSKYASDEQKPMPVDKVASFIHRSVPDHISVANGQYSLTIGGDSFGIDLASEQKCAEVLRHWFTNADVMMHMVKEAAAANDGKATLRFDSDLHEVVDEMVKKAEFFNEYPDTAAEALKGLQMPLDKAVKLASALSSPDGADAVLGTGFLSEDNLAEFAGLSSEFEDIVGKLARLLLIIRLGYPEGDESATMVAMKSLQRVAEKLRSMSSVVSA